MMTRPPARLATISSPRSRSWAAAICAKTMQTKKQRHNQSGKLDKRGFLKTKFIVVQLDAETTLLGLDERPPYGFPSEAAAAASFAWASTQSTQHRLTLCAFR